MHCDSVTVCCNEGGNLREFAGQVSFEKLKRAHCLLQCFALFTEGENTAKDFERFLAFYNAQISENPDILPVESYSDIEKAQKENKTAAVLTVENLGFTGGDLRYISRLKNVGVRMASLVWNTQNEYAYPNLVMKNGAPQFEKNCLKGLTELGREAVYELNKNKIIIDISHLSDGGVEDILALSSSPVVASHSNCRKVCNVSRNLTDSQLKKIADKGGVVGLNFCYDFITSDENADVFDLLYRHYLHAVNCGGEDLPAIGSDFDGIPPYNQMRDCTFVLKLLDYFKSRGVKEGALEKLAYGNFLRVFKEVIA